MAAAFTDGHPQSPIHPRRQAKAVTPALGEGLPFQGYAGCVRAAGFRQGLPGQFLQLGQLRLQGIPGLLGVGIQQFRFQSLQKPVSDLQLHRLIRRIVRGPDYVDTDPLIRQHLPVRRNAAQVKAARGQGTEQEKMTQLFHTKHRPERFILILDGFWWNYTGFARKT